MRARDSRQRCSLCQSERQILDVAVWRSEGSQGRLHFDEWRLRNKHFTTPPKVMCKLSEGETTALNLRRSIATLENTVDVHI